MSVDELRHLEHGHFVFAEDSPEVIVSQDVTLVGRVLEILLLDVGPDLLRHFRTGHRPGTYHDREFSADFHRLHERGIARRHISCI